MKIASIELFFQKKWVQFHMVQLFKFCIYVLKTSVRSKTWSDMINSEST